MVEKRKPKYEKPLQIRISVEQHELFVRAAELDRRSVSDWARLQLEDAAKRELKRCEQSSKLRWNASSTS